MPLTLRELSTIERLRGSGTGPIALEFAIGSTFVLSMLAVTFLNGSDDEDFELYLVPEQPDLGNVKLWTINNIGAHADAGPVFMRIPDEELRHWLFMVDPDAPQLGDKLRIEWDGDTATAWEYVLDLVPVPGAFRQRG